MSDKENKMNWKRSEIPKKDYNTESPKYDARHRSRSITSSKSKKYSVSRSRSYSRTKKRDNRKKKSSSKSRSRSSSESRGYEVSSERNIPVVNDPNKKRPSLNFLLFIKKSFENYLTSGQLLKKVKIFF